VLLILLAVVFIFAVGLHFAFPQFTEAGLKTANKLATGILEGSRRCPRSREVTRWQRAAGALHGESMER